jgi:L-ribulokinase
VADVLGMEIKVARSEQACALGAAMCAAVASGVYPTLLQAQKAMGGGFERVYKPNPGNAGRYMALYDSYSKLGTFIESRIRGGE